jgi:FkbM family methyltransferase
VLPLTAILRLKSRVSLAPLLVKIGQRTPLGRGAARKGLLRIIKKLDGGPIETTFRGVPMQLHLDNPAEYKPLLSPLYNKVELDFLARFLEGHPSTFVDIGANFGLFTQYLATRMPKGSLIVAIEPNPAMCARMTDNLEILRRHDLAEEVSIHVESSAAGPAEGVARLQISAGFGEAYILDASSPEGIEVPVRRLSEILGRRGVVALDAVKIDVEGYEDRVLGPYFQEVPRLLFPRALVIEFTHRSRWRQDLLSQCMALGYREQARTRGNVLLALATSP